MTRARWYTEKREPEDVNVVAWNERITRFWSGNHNCSFIGNTATAAGYVTGYTTKGE